MKSSVRSLLRDWSTLAPVQPHELAGEWAAEFVAPLRRLAPVGLGLIGLPRWYGKRFEASVDRADGDTVAGVNLIRERDTQRFAEVLPMQVSLVSSFADAQQTLAVHYPADARLPWRWVRDEFRWLQQGHTLVGLTFVDQPVLRRAAVPFLLHRVPQPE